MSIGARLFPANMLIPLQRLQSLAFGFGTFASQKTELSRLTRVFYVFRYTICDILFAALPVQCLIYPQNTQEYKENTEGEDIP